MSFDSSSEFSLSSSSGYHGVTKKQSPAMTGRRSSINKSSHHLMTTKKHSLSDAALTTDFAGLAVSPCNKSKQIEEAVPTALV
jgi:hypothetical protein